jgi:hypothetical protein
VNEYIEPIYTRVDGALLLRLMEIRCLSNVKFAAAVGISHREVVRWLREEVRVRKSVALHVLAVLATIPVLIESKEPITGDLFPDLAIADHRDLRPPRDWYGILRELAAQAGDGELTDEEVRKVRTLCRRQTLRDLRVAPYPREMQRLSDVVFALLDGWLTARANPGDVVLAYQSIAAPIRAQVYGPEVHPELLEARTRLRDVLCRMAAIFVSIDADQRGA